VKKPRKLRAPFVATFAIAAGACGGRVDHVDPGPPSGGVNPPAQVADAGGACPTATPDSGGACDLVSGTDCNYGNCYGQPDTSATCLNGTWEVRVASCNPPAPPAPTCPATEPREGDQCAPTVPADCTYHENECNEANGYKSPIAYSCRNGVWEVSGGGSCNPPAQVCPTAPPQDGTPCYGGLKCPYGDCYGAPTTFATCTNGTWNVLNSSCNPPVPDAGGD
jgi:hypothetical protein